MTEPMKHNDWLSSARFSPHGKRIVTTSYDGTARVWDVAPLGPGFPDWLVELAEAVCGQRLNNQGGLQAAGQDPAEVIGCICQQLAHESTSDDWVVWGRWFLADRATRTISPFSKVTVPEYIENRIKENTPSSLAEAEQLAYGNTDLLARDSGSRKKFEGVGERSLAPEKKE